MRLGLTHDPQVTGYEMSVVASLAANCWLAAANATQLPPELLYAIAEVESGFRGDAVARANNGTRSVGVMQVNSVWFPMLAKAGIDERQLRDPCTNIHVGAWILSREVRRYGYSWEAIGAYYAGPHDKPHLSWRLKHYHGYANRVLAAWERLNRKARDVSARR